MEDGVTLAHCLFLAGKHQIPAALRAYQDIRYERVKAVQKTGETTRDMWHKADWEKVKKNPKEVEMPREEWILGFDAEVHVRKVFDEVFAKYADITTNDDAAAAAAAAAAATTASVC
jgi:2-polyprenyl-6-methoxyphenol hydroxylase-like FAD-dependent oxidoreductase